MSYKLQWSGGLYIGWPVQSFSITLCYSLAKPMGHVRDTNKLKKKEISTRFHLWSVYIGPHIAQKYQDRI